MMSTETAARQIRQLTDARDRGELALPDYRQRRGAILDALVGLASTPGASSARPPAETPTRPGASPAAAPPPKAASRAEPARRAASKGAAGSRTPLLIGIGIAVVLAVGAFLMLGRRGPAAGAGSDGESASSVSADAGSTRSAAAAIDDFLRRNDWSDGAISALNRVWWSLSDQEILAAYSSDAAKRLGDELQRRLQGRGRPGGPAPLDPDSPLLMLARNLNVTVPEGAVGRAGAIDESTAASARPAAPSAKVAAAAPPPPPARSASPAPSKPAASATVVPATAAPAGVASSAAAPGASNDPCAVFFTNPKKRSCHDEWAGGRGPDLMVVSPGKFRMGSTQSPEEQPLRDDVRILRPFAMTRFEITVGDYRAYCTATKRPCTNLGGADDLPVVFVSWKDAHDYAAWLSETTGQRYRLPSEAEWEYAARAGTTGEPGQEREALRPDFNARFSAPGAVASGPAGTHQAFQANEFGLYHMFGNVREWVQDAWVPDLRQLATDGSAHEGGGARVVRGGSFHDGPAKVRPGAREALDPAAHDAMTGFRLVRELRSP